MRVLLNIISVTFLSFSITTLPINDDYYDDDITDSFQPAPDAHGSPTGNAFSKWKNTYLMNLEKMSIGDGTRLGLGRSGLKNKANLWPNAYIYISIEGSYNREQLKLIKLAMDTLDYWTCIRFAPYNSSLQKDYIAIVNTPNKGCKSSVGYQGGRQEIILEASKCFDKVGTVLHELLHAIGLIDEHRRPNRNEYILVHENNIKHDERERFRKYSYDNTYNYGVPYDYNSVMHYPENAYSRNGLLTIVPLVRGVKIGQKDGMSVRDAIKVANMYNCYYETNTTRNYSQILPTANNVTSPRDSLVVRYFNEKMNRPKSPTYVITL